MLGNLLTGKGIVRAGIGKGIVKAGTGHPSSSTSYNHSLNKKKEWKCTTSSFNKLWNTKSESRFNGVFSRNHLSKKIKDGAHIINLDEYTNVGAQWIALSSDKNEIVYFDSFGVEHIPKEIKKLINNKNIIANIFRVQTNDSVMCGYFCIGFIDCMLAGKNLTNYTNLFFPYD